MLFVGEARDAGVGRFGEASANEPAFGEHGKAGQAAAGQEVVDQCGDEDGLAGAAEAGNADPEGGRDAPGRGIGEIVERDADFVGEAGRRLRHAGPVPAMT